MSDALTPLRQVYGLEPDSRAETPEHEALRGLREVLDAQPPLSPPPDVLSAVRAYAAQPRDVLTFESDQQAAALAPVLDALDRVPRPTPPASVLEAVMARAAEPRDELTFETGQQAAMLAPVLDALDRMPRPAPSDSVMASVEARASDAASSLSAVRHVYMGAAAPATDTPASIEAEVLRQSRQAIERSLISHPRAQPSADVMEVILARAAQASRQDDEIPAQSPVEAAVIAQSLQALDRLPRPSPSASSVAAVLAAAAIPPSAPLAAPDANRQRPAAPARDRAPERTRRRPIGVWAGASALVMAVAVAVMLLPGDVAEIESAAPLAVAEQVESGPAAPAPLVAAVAPDDPAPALRTAPSGSALAASAAIAGYVPAVERSSPRPAAPAQATTPTTRPVPPTPTPSASPQAVSSAPAATLGTDPAPSWEASDDVRALSLRLQELDNDALAWDEPAEAFGAPARSARTSTPGVQAVRSRARMIDSNDQ